MDATATATITEPEVVSAVALLIAGLLLSDCAVRVFGKNFLSTEFKPNIAVTRIIRKTKTMAIPITVIDRPFAITAHLLYFWFLVSKFSEWVPVGRTVDEYHRIYTLSLVPIK